MQDANQSPGEDCSATVTDMTERRREQLVTEHMDRWEEMAMGAVRNLVDSPTELGDVPHVSPYSWSRARNGPDYNALLKVVALMAERWTEGADREDVLEVALVPLTFCQTLFSLDDPDLDVPDSIERVVARISDSLEVTTEAIMDGELTPDEKARMRDAFRALQAAAREGQTAVSQTAEQTSLWPARANGPRV